MSTTTPPVFRLLGENVQEALQGHFIALLGADPVVTTTDDRTHVDIVSAGLSLVAFADGRVSAIQLYADGYQSHDQFSGVMPFNFTFKTSREQVRDKLGTPTVSGGGTASLLYGKAPAWDRYDTSAFSLHIQYSEDTKQIQMITIMLPDAVPK
jgi:hypothetical protein